MSISTGRGDDGWTDLPDGRRVRKSDPICHAMGDLEELSCWIGLAVSACPADQKDIREWLGQILSELLPVGRSLHAPAAASGLAASLDERLSDMSPQLPAITAFIQPMGTELTCRLHVARAVCRRAERSVVAAGGPEGAVVYLNRLSDVLFQLARLANHRAGVADQPWKGPRP